MNEVLMRETRQTLWHSGLRASMVIFGLCLGLLLPQAGTAQGLFSAAVTVNGRAITGYEIEQRIALLRVFRTPGVLEEVALEQLIDDRLKQQELDRVGLALSDESLLTAMEEFAGRASLSLEQFVAVLNQNNIDEAALRDFVMIGASWRDYVRSRFNSRTEITEAEIDAALGLAGTADSGIEVLLTEIIISAPPPEATAAMATAERISQLTSFEAFEAEARRVSALPSRDVGGRLDWLPISNYPANLRSLLLTLAPGDVTAPIGITNGVALFQLRDIREVPVTPQPPAEIDYAAFYIPGGRSEAALWQAQILRNQVDTCDDLYGAAQGLPVEVLDRDSLAPDQIPQDIAMELAKLDPGEVSTALTRTDGSMLVFLMLCSRTPELGQPVDREAVRNQLRSQRLAGFAEAALADLRAAATITYP